MCTENQNNVEYSYNRIAPQWAKYFIDEHEKKPMDKEILSQFYEK